MDADCFRKKGKHDVCFFSSALPTAMAVGYTSPFEALRDGFATGTTEVTTERREWREQTPPIFL